MSTVTDAELDELHNADVTLPALRSLSLVEPPNHGHFPEPEYSDSSFYTIFIPKLLSIVAKQLDHVELRSKDLTRILTSVIQYPCPKITSLNIDTSLTQYPSS